MVGKHPPPEADPPNCAYLLWSSACCTSTDRRRADSTRIHPKIGSTLKSRRRVRAAGKPSDEPLREGETQSLTDFYMRNINKLLKTRFPQKPSSELVIRLDFVIDLTETCRASSQRTCDDSVYRRPCRLPDRRQTLSGITLGEVRKGVQGGGGKDRVDPSPLLPCNLNPTSPRICYTYRQINRFVVNKCDWAQPSTSSVRRGWEGSSLNGMRRGYDG